MSRKPFEALTGESFEDAYGITQHDWNGRPDIPWMEVQARSRDVANAAIAQDSSFHSEKVAALLAERADLIETASSWASWVNDLITERDALREENERLKAEYTEAETAFENLIQDYREGRDKAQVKFADALKVIEESTWHPDHRCEKCVERNNAAREFLAKVKA